MTDLAFLAFSLGPVQSFISSARTVRDLWSGSFLLSWLAYRAMEPLQDEQLIFPDLKSHPLRLWEKNHCPKPAPSEVLEPCLPNRFLAEVSAKDADDLGNKCKGECTNAWKEICEKVRSELWKTGHHHDTLSETNSLWQRQVAGFFEIKTVFLPFAACDEAELQRLLASMLPIGTDDEKWIARREITGKLLQASRSVRHFPSSEAFGKPDVKIAQKCSLLGTHEHIGPGDRDEARDFWKTAAESWRLHGTRVGERERLSAVSLVKRYAWPLYFQDQFGYAGREDDPLRFEDTATVAATFWLDQEPKLIPQEVRRKYRKQKKTWSGQWIYLTSPGQEGDDEAVPDEKGFAANGKSVFDLIQEKRRLQGRPPAYYVVVMIDGDNMGDRLMHAGRKRTREISRALAHFALNRAPDIVKKHKGDLVYAGGDDVLALLPTETALGCARELNEEFTKNGPKLDENDRATVSAGLVVAHVKEDLRFVLDEARRAEKAAKNHGRDAFVIKVCRRSGEHSEALCPWDQLGWLSSLSEAFLDNASDRWAYQLKAELPTLRGLGEEAIRAEIRRQVNRAEQQTKDQLAKMDAIEALFSQYKDTRDAKGELRLQLPEALEHFVTLCQTASFLARGRDA